ncbi:hypothetical protein MNBD_CHLOROFLEXI01-3758 [hydrothermal vent metagenome]|uniref:Uncharacterized protein n=1 Tax=hydrothermal vent metagenome TaxID=652676 RepID=A0A3B0VZJ1_9ZZZZ
MQNEIEIMRILRIPPMGKLVVAYKDKRYTAIEELSEQNVRQLLHAAIGELITFAGGYQTLVDAGVAPALAAKQSKTTSAQTGEAAQFLEKMEKERDQVKAAKPKPAPSLLANLRPRPARNKASVTKMLSLVEQVDAILQRHLLTDPELGDRTIHLVQDPSGGLIIEVDGKRYQRPREIDDPRIQLMIKKALKEWEAS